MKLDIIQNQWFKENNMKLIRITDKQFHNLSFDEIIDILEV